MHLQTVVTFHNLRYFVFVFRFSQRYTWAFHSSGIRRVSNRFATFRENGAVSKRQDSITSDVASYPRRKN